MKRSRKEDNYIFLGVLVIPIIWGALLCAPYMDKGLLVHINEITDHPFQIQWCNYTIRTVCLFLMIYFFIVLYYLNEYKNTRRKEEYGSAKWGDTKRISKRYECKSFTENKILTQNFRMGLNGKLHKRNLNTMIVGGSGAGKTRFYAKPNIMQCNTSYVVLDPNGKEVLGYILQAVH